MNRPDRLDNERKIHAMKPVLQRLLYMALTALAITGLAWADDLLLPKGTVVPVALIQDVSTAIAKVGDKIKAVYTGDDEGGFPTGTVFVATVSEASPKTSKSNGMIKAAFNQAILPNKKTVAIQGKAVNGKSSASEKSKKETGKGAAIGAVAGMAVAGNNVAGALLGGAAGGLLGHRRGSKPQDIVFRKAPRLVSSCKRRPVCRR
jgi:hypothetical protein